MLHESESVYQIIFCRIRSEQQQAKQGSPESDAKAAANSSLVPCYILIYFFQFFCYLFLFLLNHILPMIAMHLSTAEKEVVCLN